jgi:hypothetical protein
MAIEKNKAASKTVQDRAEKLMGQGWKLDGEADGVAEMHSEKRSEVDLESGVTPHMICHPLVHASVTNMEA